MPRLSYPEILKGQAAAALIDIYMQDKNFVNELDAIRKPYIEHLGDLAISSFEAGKSMKSLSFSEYKKTIDSPGHGTIKEAQPALEPYCQLLTDLASKWKLRVSWAVPMLLMYDMCGIAKLMGLMPPKINLPMGLYENLYPFEAPLPPLIIKVPAWAMVLEGREEVLTDIRIQLEDYEKKLKAKGLKEFPSSLKKHALWWFKHYIYGMKYDDIAQEEAYSKDNSLIAFAGNVGRAVREFSKLIGFSSKDLKG